MLLALSLIALVSTPVVTLQLFVRCADNSLRDAGHTRQLDASRRSNLKFEA